MKEIKCPKCNELFTLDDSSYLAILKQVESQEFDHRLKQGIDKEVKIALLKQDSDHKKEMDDMKARHDKENKFKDDEIASLRDYQLKRPTKMVGESLEKYCEYEFEKLRHIGFQSASFQKDNDASSGSKGDYIFRDFDPDGNEYISIMFEMKNESDHTATKKKNIDFLKELDKDRTEKKCEYAVLVSYLEPENELYNTGMTDVSHYYPKMYVIRPTYFINLISMLRNAAKNTIPLRSELSRAQQHNMDFTNFLKKVDEFRGNFAKNVGLTQKKSNEVIEQIDKAIKSLEAAKRALQDTTRYLGKADGDLTDLMDINLSMPKVKEIDG